MPYSGFTSRVSGDDSYAEPSVTSPLAIRAARCPRTSIRQWYSFWDQRRKAGRRGPQVERMCRISSLTSPDTSTLSSDSACCAPRPVVTAVGILEGTGKVGSAAAEAEAAPGAAISYAGPGFVAGDIGQRVRPPRARRGGMAVESGHALDRRADVFGSASSNLAAVVTRPVPSGGE
jgi:hypothetical protein